MKSLLRHLLIGSMCLLLLIPTNGLAQVSLESIKAVAWSPDGSKIAVAGIEGLLQIRNSDGSLFMDISTNTDGIFFSVAWSPDGKKIATVGNDINVRVWNISDPQYSPGTLIATFDGHNDRPLAVAWSPDGTKLASGSLFGVYQVIVWDVVSFQSQPLTQQVVAGVYALAWSPDGSQIAIGSAGGVLILDANLNILPYAPAPDYRLGDDKFTPAIAWGPDGSMVVGGYDTGEVIIFDVASKSQIMPLQGHSSLVAAVSWSPDGSRIVTGSYDGTIRIWDANSGLELDSISYSNDVGLTSVVWSPDGSQVAYGGEDGQLHIIPTPNSSGYEG